MKATFTVKKDVLKNRLQAQIDHIQTRYNNSTRRLEYVELREKLANGESLDQFKERMLEWHREVVKGLENGTISVTKTGALHGGPPKPQRGKFMSQWDGRWTVEGVDRQLCQMEEQLEHVLKPIRVSMEILDMASGDEVQIDAADYHALLNNEQSTRHYW